MRIPVGKFADITEDSVGHRELTTVFSDLRNVPPEPLYHSQLNWMAAMALQMDIAMELFQDTYSHCVNRAIEDYPNSTIDTVQYCAEKWTWTTISESQPHLRKWMDTDSWASG